MNCDGCESVESENNDGHEVDGTCTAARKIWNKLDIHYKEYFQKRYKFFNNTYMTGELTYVDYLSYLDVIPSSLVSDELSSSEMLTLHALTKYWDRFTRKMQCTVVSAPTRYFSQKSKVFGLQKAKVKTQSFLRLDVGELVLRAVFGEGFNKLHKKNSTSIQEFSGNTYQFKKRMVSLFLVKDVCAAKYPLNGSDYHSACGKVSVSYGGKEIIGFIID